FTRSSRSADVGCVSLEGRIVANLRRREQVCCRLRTVSVARVAVLQLLRDPPLELALRLVLVETRSRSPRPARSERAVVELDERSVALGAPEALRGAELDPAVFGLLRRRLRRGLHGARRLDEDDRPLIGRHREPPPRERPRSDARPRSELEGAGLVLEDVEEVEARRPLPAVRVEDR